jgi:hypothetical protein
MRKTPSTEAKRRTGWHRIGSRSRSGNGCPTISVLGDGKAVSITLGSEFENEFTVGDRVAVGLSDDGRSIGIKKLIDGAGGYKFRQGEHRRKHLHIGALGKIAVHGEDRSFACCTFFDAEEGGTWWFDLPEAIAIKQTD